MWKSPDTKEGMLVFSTLSLLLSGLISCQGIQSSLESSLQLTISNGSTNNVMRCGFNQDLQDAHIIHMSIESLDSCNVSDIYSSLAHINVWTKEPVRESIDFATDVIGQINSDNDSETFLSLTLDANMISQSKRSFKCVVQGVNMRGQPQTLSKNITYGTCISNQVIELKLDTGRLDSAIHSLEDKVGIIDATVKDDVDTIEKLNTTVDGIAARLETVDDMSKRNADYVVMLNRTIQSQDLEMEALDTETKGLSDSIKVLDSKLDGTGENISTLTVTVNVMDEEIGELTSKVRGNGDNIMTLNNKMKGMEALDTRVEKLIDNFETIKTTTKNMKSDIQALNSKFDHLQTSVDKMQDKYKNSRSLDIEASGFHIPSTANVFKSKLYLFSKSKAKGSFDIDDANGVCRRFGGYLLEIHNEEEYNFVHNIVKGMDQQFYTGYTDRDNGKQHLHVESGKELPIDKWRPGDPSFYDYMDECVILSNDGLADLFCKHNHRYICEVPISG